MLIGKKILHWTFWLVLASIIPVFLIALAIQDHVGYTKTISTKDSAAKLAEIRRQNQKEACIDQHVRDGLRVNIARQTLKSYLDQQGRGQSVTYFTDRQVIELVICS